MSYPKILLFLYELYYKLTSLAAVKMLILLFILIIIIIRLIINNPVKWDPRYYIISICFS
jgi:hypothetical protein